MLAEQPRRAAEDLLEGLDRAIPGRIDGFYVVGSASMGAFRPGRSDVDFVAVLDGPLRAAELRRLRSLHLGCWRSALLRDTLLHRRWPLACNGIYVAAGDLARSPLEVTPLAAHVAGRFRAGTREGFDVNPVTWRVLADRGIALRGPESGRLEIHTDEAELREWVLENLNTYWRRWTRSVWPAGAGMRGVPPRRAAASGVLGAPRLHHTIATGAIATREAAAHYALERFQPRWAALIEDALAYWRGEPASEPYRRHPRRRHRHAVAFVAAVIEDANRLAQLPRRP